MLVETNQLPERGSYVEIIGPSNSITGKVVWARNGRFALRTRERLDIAASAAGQTGLKLHECPEGNRNGRPSRNPGFSAERSRTLSARFQNAALLLCAVLGSAGIAAFVYLKLSSAFTAIVAAMA